jgi:multiple antibiotic resistance protein
MNLKHLITLLAIVNPLAVVPFFIHYTQGMSEKERRKVARMSSLTVFIVIAASALLGLDILEFFSISLPGFQVGGSLLLLMSAGNPPNFHLREK